MPTRTKEEYAELRRQGLCVRCGYGADGFAYCATCRKDNRSYQRGLHRRRIERGLCGVCGKPAPCGRKTCESCAARAGAVMLATREKRKAEGMRIRCGCDPAEPPHVTCADCRDLARAGV